MPENSALGALFFYVRVFHSECGCTQEKLVDRCAIPLMAKRARWIDARMCSASPGCVAQRVRSHKKSDEAKKGDAAPM